MTFRKILHFVFFVSLSAGIVSAQNRLIDGWKYEIPKTSIVPVIDGIQDSVWKALDWNYQTSYDNNGGTLPDGFYDMLGASKVMYDDNNLYCIFYSQDDDPYGNDAAVVNWQRNAIEVYLDGDNSKIHSVVFPDHHLTFRHEHIGDEAGSDWDIETGLDSTGIEWKILDDANMVGFWTEFKIPLDNLDMTNVAGTEVGIEFQQDDNDGAGRDVVSKWFQESGDSSWQYASTWGIGVQTDRVVDEKFQILKVPAAGPAPVIDGVLDDVFKASTSTTQNHFGNNGTYPDDFADNQVRTYLLYDDDNLYGFFEVWDDDPYGNDAAVVNWQRNAVELYLDGDNSKLHSVVFPDHHLTFRHEHIGDEAGSDWDLETGLDSTGIEWKIVDTTPQVAEFSLVGYNVEFKIPLDALDMVNTLGQVIGLEVQTDDNDGAGRDVVTKWAQVSGDSSWQYASTWSVAILGPAVVLDVRELPNQIPTQFSLSQNYPNPFNPSTKITFSITDPGLVTLKVYNLLGQEVATLVNEELVTNTYEVDFDASSLPSGVYFYKIEAGSSSIAKKMMLLK